MWDDLFTSILAFLKLKTFKMLQILWLSARFRNGFNYSVRFVCLFGESIGGTSPVIGVCFLYTRTPFIRSERYALGIISTNPPTSHDSYFHLFLFLFLLETAWPKHRHNVCVYFPRLQKSLIIISCTSTHMHPCTKYKAYLLFKY